jgi:hypothetical protein
MQVPAFWLHRSRTVGQPRDLLIQVTVSTGIWLLDLTFLRSGRRTRDAALSCHWHCLVGERHRRKSLRREVVREVARIILLAGCLSSNVLSRSNSQVCPSPVLGAVVARRIHGYQHSGQAQCDGREVCPLDVRSVKAALSPGRPHRRRHGWGCGAGRLFARGGSRRWGCFGVVWKRRRHLVTGSEVLAEVGGGPQCAALHISTSPSIIDI